MKMIKIWLGRTLLSILLLLCLPVLSYAGTATLTKVIQPNSTSGIDSTIYKYNATSNYGDNTYVRIGRGSDAYRGLLQFDLSQIPADANITNGTLRLYYYSGSGTSTPMDVGVYQLTRNWGETTVTWNKADSSTNWSVPGGDYQSSPVSTVTGITSTSGWYIWDITNTAQSWHTTPASNYGIILKTSDAIETGTHTVHRSFYSSEYTSNLTLTPKLEVTYTITDNDNPNVSIDSPKANVKINGTTKINIDANDQTSNIVKVEIYRDGQQKTVITGAPYEYYWDTTGVTDGNHVITAKAYDTANNIGLADRNVVVDNTTLAVVKTIQPDVTQGMDSYLRKSSSSTNYGTTSYIYVGGSIDNIYRGLIKFDLSSIPANSQIVKAEARLTYYGGTSTSTPIDISVHPVTQSWDEMDVTWRDRDDYNSWNVPGGDYRVLSEGTVKGITEGTTFSWDITSLAQGWYDNTLPNNGIILKGNFEQTYTDSSRRFYSSDYEGNFNYRPQLIVTYFVPDTTPPTVIVDSPKEGAKVKGLTKINVDAYDDLNEVTTVEVYVDSQLKDTLNSAPYEYYWDTTGASDGNHVITAKAYDLMGNIGVATNRNVIVDNTTIAITKIIQPDDDQGVDSFLDESRASYNYETSSYIHVGGSVDNIQRGLIKFDLSSIPANSQIVKAEARLTYYGGTLVSTPIDISVHPVTQSWDEMDVTWRDRDYDNLWNVPGGDYRALPENTVKGITNGTTYSWDVTSLAQGWYDNTLPNNGIILKGNFEQTYTNSSRRFYSSDYEGNFNYRPQLIVTYFVPDTTPPTVIVDSPKEGAKVKGLTKINVDAYDDLNEVTTVEVYVDSQLKDTLNSAPYEYYWDTTGVSDGNHVITAKAYDLMGNIGVATNRNVIVDNTTIAVTKIIQPDDDQGVDSFLDESRASYNYETSSYIHVGGSVDNIQRGLIEFDLSSIPANSQIVKAEARLTYYGGTLVSTPIDISVHPVIQSWDEMYVTWRDRDDYNSWNVPGGDYRALPEDTVKGITNGTTYSWDITSLAQGWYDNTLPNNGIILKGNFEQTYTDSSRRFYSSDYEGNFNYRPQLIVTYFAPDTTPPTVIVDSPKEGAKVKGLTKINVDAYDDLNEVTTVEVYVDSQLKDTLNSAPYEYYWDTTGASDGNHVITAKAYDLMGNIGVATNRNVIVDNTTIAITKIIQPDDDQGGVDSFLDESRASYNYETSSYIHVGGSVDNIQRGLIEFDLSSVPANSQIVKAEARLTYYGGTLASTPIDISVHPVIQSWDEMYVTWRDRDDYNSWNVPGGDYRALPEDTVKGITNGTTYSWDITSLAQGWYDNTLPNNGIILKGNFEQTYTDSSRRFYSSDYEGNFNYRPQLIVTYFVPDTTPPTVIVDSPKEGSKVKGLTKINVDAYDDLNEVTTVEVYVDSQLKDTLNSAPYEYYWDTTGVSDGNHVITAKAYDLMGNIGVTTNRNVIVDNTTIAVTKIIQPDDDQGGVDSSLDESEDSNDYGTTIHIYVGGSIDNIYRGLIKFDLSSIPANSQIVKAEARLTYYGGALTSTPIDISVHPVTQSWDEMYVTWRDRDDDNLWNIPGGDYRALPEDTVKGITNGTMYSWDVTSLAQGWYDNTLPNNGIILKGNFEQTYTNSFRRFYSSDYEGNSNYRPQLIITYFVPDTISVSGITLNKISTNINIGGTETLVATVTPTNATNKTVTWTSSNPEVALVADDGVITGIAEGTAIVTATTVDGGFTATCTVQVGNVVSVSGITLNKISTNINIGGTETLVATVTPTNATNKTVTWTSSNPEVALVADDGVITGIAEGTAIVTATTVDGGFTATCTVQVGNVVSVSGITLNKISTNINIGGTETLVATVTPTNATNKTVTWTSSNPAVALVADDGVITGIAEGTAIVTATTVDGGFTATCMVNCTEFSGPQSLRYIYDVNNRLNQIELPGNLIQYQYDANGNLIERH